MYPPQDISTFPLVLATVFATALLVLYFLPTIFSVACRQPKCAEVFGVNLLVGWTGLGWLAALFMAGSEQALADPPRRTVSNLTPKAIATHRPRRAAKPGVASPSSAFAGSQERPAHTRSIPLAAATHLQ